MRKMLAALLLCLAGCGEELELQQLGFVEVESVGVHPLCTHMQEVLAAESWRVAETLGVERPEGVTVRLGTIDEVAERCEAFGEGLPGCTFVRDGTVVVESTLGVFVHELVHALRFQQDDTYTGHFFEEGLAELVSSGTVSRLGVSVATPRDPSAILGSVDAALQDVPYVLAGHFVAWLSQHHGLDRVIAFYTAPSTSPSDVHARFETQLGVSLEDAAEEWAVDAPVSIDLHGRCHASIPLDWAGDGITVDVDIGCSAEGSGPWPTSDGRQTMTGSLCFEVEEAAELEVRVASSSTSLDVRFSSVECYGSGSAEEFGDKSISASNEPVLLPFGPCLWQVTLSDDIDAAGSVSLEIRR